MGEENVDQLAYGFFKLFGMGWDLDKLFKILSSLFCKKEKKML